MALLNAVTISVADLQQSRSSYEFLGFEVEKDFPGFIGFKPKDGGIVLALYPRDGLASLVGVAIGAGSGFNGVVLDCNLPARERVDEVMNRAEKSGGKIIHEARDAEW